MYGVSCFTGRLHWQYQLSVFLLSLFSLSLSIFRTLSFLFLSLSLQMEDCGIPSMLSTTHSDGAASLGYANEA